jgi:hypothetical protein
VKITDHDYLSESRDDVTVTSVGTDYLILLSKKPWSSQGWTFPAMNFAWGGDKEVDGRTVRLYRTPSPHTGKSRRLIKTFVFTPPKEH